MKYIVANWKMNMDSNSIASWFSDFSKIYKPNENIKVIICGSFVHLELIKNYIEKYNLPISVSAQDISLKEKGAHTGEVGGFQLKNYCEFALVGHSERNETRDVVTKKRDEALAAGLIPIVCFTSPDQLEDAYKPGVILAWEDPQNISKNGVYFEKPQDDIVDMFNKFAEMKPNAEIIYGGSVNRQNIHGVAKILNLHGVLPGNASIDPAHFNELVGAFK